MERRDIQMTIFKFGRTKMKTYKKLALITAILGLIVLVTIIAGFAYVNSLIGFPILGFLIGGFLLQVFLLLVINVGSLFVTFKIKNPKLAGILLILCGGAILALASFLGIPSFVLFCASGVLAFREKADITTNKMV